MLCPERKNDEDHILIQDDILNVWTREAFISPRQQCGLHEDMLVTVFVRKH